jgi:hypothetical protein
MRPKVVILILAVGFGLVAIMVVLKGVMAGHSGNAGGQTPATQANVDSQSAATNNQVVQVNPDSSNTAASSEQMRAAVVENELDQIRELQGDADGSNNPMIISALLDKVANPEAEVRGAALDALRQIRARKWPCWTRLTISSFPMSRPMCRLLITRITLT